MADIVKDIGSFAGDVFKGAGDIAGSTAGFLAHPLERGYEKTQIVKSHRQSMEINQLFEILRGDFSDEDKENAARKIVQIAQPKLYEQRLQQDPGARFYQPILNRGEQKQKALDPYGRQSYGSTAGGARTAADPIVKAADDIGKIQDARNKFEGDITDETAAFFDAAEASIKSKAGFAEPLINPQTGKPRRIFGTPGTPQAGKVIGTRNKDKTMTPTDVRGLFSGGVSPFETLPEPKVGDALSYDRITRQPRTVLGEEGIKPLADYFQSATEAVPEENVPQTFEQLGMTDTSEQETFQQLEKAVGPELDLRGIYITDPQGFKKILDALRAGKTPSGKPFGIKDALKMLEAFRM